MSSYRRRSQQRLDIWPGYVDALASLLMVVIFLLMIFSIAQMFLSQSLDKKDNELESLNTRISEISNLLNLRNDENIELKNVLEMVSGEVSDLENETKKQSQRINLLDESITQLTTEGESLSHERDNLGKALEETRSSLSAKEATNRHQEEQLRTLNLQITLLRSQLEQIANALVSAETATQEKEIELKDLSQRLNLALAKKVNELEQYRSEFFATLKKSLSDTDGVIIQGDRFILPSELLFKVGSASIGQAGKQELKTLAKTLTLISDKIPEDLEWILRIDGHTDAQPITSQRYTSNWSLSVARAVSVVEFLQSEGIDPSHLAATGFGENHPIDPGKTPDSYRKNRRIEFKLTNR